MYGEVEEPDSVGRKGVKMQKWCINKKGKIVIWRESLKKDEILKLVCDARA